MKKKLPMIIRLLVLGALLGWAFVAHRRRAAREKLFSGTLEYTEHLVGARASGRLASTAFEEGDAVKQGQLLAVLDRYEQSRKDLARAERLHARDGVSDQELERARLALEDQEIVSPVDGVVLSKVREAGEVVAAGGAVAVVGRDQAPWVRVFVPENRLAKISVGQAVELRFDGLDKTVPGRVTLVAPKAEFTPRNAQTPEERATMTFAVKVSVEEKDPALKPGLSADVIFK